MRPSGGNHKTLKKYVRAWGISTAHFDPAAARRPRGRARPLEEVLVAGSEYSRQSLKRRLFSEGIKDQRCELCGQDEQWRGRRMALILDHINGVPRTTAREPPDRVPELRGHPGHPLRTQRGPRPGVRGLPRGVPANQSRATPLLEAVLGAIGAEPPARTVERLPTRS
jgi:hypothetical protein